MTGHYKRKEHQYKENWKFAPFFFAPKKNPKSKNELANREKGFLDSQRMPSDKSNKKKKKYDIEEVSR